MKNLPPWFRQDIPGKKQEALSEFLFIRKIDTVCRQALCPNINACFENNQLTFLILGKQCTRSCSFCNIEKYRGEDLLLDADEPSKIAQAVKDIGIKYAVVTSVTRDDLPDGGAANFSETVKAITSLNPDVKTEVLIPDFRGERLSIEVVVRAGPYIIAHNIETVRRLYPEVRPQADYERSLKVLSIIKEVDRNIFTKSSLMLGMGEKQDEVFEAMEDLRKNNCDFITLGQYLAPSDKHYPAFEFLTPEQFKSYEDKARIMGFKNVSSGPLVRSSYFAHTLLGELKHA
jgi:lipoic acid synthetase